MTASTGAPATVRLSRSFTTFWAAAATSGMGDGIVLAAAPLIASRLRPHREQVRAAASAPGHPLRGLMRDMATGAKRLWRHRLLRNLAAISGVLNFVGAGAMAVMVVYTHRSLHLSDFGYGVLFTARAVGSVLAALLAPALVSRIGRDRALVLVAALYALANLGLSFFPVWWVAATGFLVIAYGSVTWDVVVVALRQTLIPSELQGRVNSVYRLVAWGAIPLGAPWPAPSRTGSGRPPSTGSAPA